MKRGRSQNKNKRREEIEKLSLRWPLEKRSGCGENRKKNKTNTKIVQKKEEQRDSQKTAFLGVVAATSRKEKNAEMGIRWGRNARKKGVAESERGRSKGSLTSRKRRQNVTGRKKRGGTPFWNYLKN